MVRPSTAANAACRDDKQKSQGKQSSLSAVRRPYKECLLLLRVSPFCSEACPT